MKPEIIVLALSSISLSALAQIALRKTMLTVDGLFALPLLRLVLGLATSPWFLAGIACYAFSIVLWLGVLSKTEVSLAYPLSSIGFVLTAVIGYLYLNESVGLLRISGIALICTGIVILAQSA